MRIVKRWLIVVAALAAASGAERPEVMVAAASNLTEVLSTAGRRFEARTGIHATFSFASTAQLTRQIENGAPFDVLLAADTAHVDELDRKGLLAAGSRALYARGVLALWIPPSGPQSVQRLEDLAGPQVRYIAIAKPELAPYGQAAVDSLTRLGLWNAVQPKVVYAENINMAKQYGVSKNADAVLTAYSLVFREAGKAIAVDEKLHEPINQELAVMRAAPQAAAARRFAAFLLSVEGQELLAGFGYAPPGLR